MDFYVKRISKDFHLSEKLKHFDSKKKKKEKLKH